MALLKLGAIVTQVSGKVGGQSFGTSGSHSTLKNIGTSSNKRTVKQMGQRNKTSTVSSLWRSLTAVQKQSFADEAPNYKYTNRIGELSTYSAFNLFQKLNQGRLLIVESVIKTCPSFVALTTPPITFNNHSVARFSVWAAAVYPLQKYVISATPPLSTGISNPHKYFKKMDIATNAELAATFDFGDKYYETYGSPSVGSQVFVGLTPVIIANGYQTGIMDFTSEIVEP